MKKITKNELVDNIYNCPTNLDRKQIQFVIDEFLNQLKLSLEDGATIELRGFGTLEPRLRKGRSVARNPKTGKTLSVKPHYVAAFRAGKDLKEKLWKLDPTKND